MVIDKFATANVFNFISLFIGNLTPAKECSIIMVVGSDYRPTHYGSSTFLMRDDTVTIVGVPMHNALCFPSSPVNVVSVIQISLQHGDG